MARGDNISTTVPSVGDSETGGTSDLLTIVTALVAIAETKVTPSEIDMDATLDFNSQSADNVKSVEFITQLSSPGNERLYTQNDGATDELYFTNGSGQSVQITNGGSLNVAATGSVTGAGYGSSGVEINWNSAGTEYRMKSGSGADDYASVVCDNVEFRDGSSHAVTFTAQGMSADYTVTLPAALDANAGLLSMDASGNIQHSGSITIASGDPITFTDYADWKHGSVTENIPMLTSDHSNFTGTWTASAAGVWTTTTNGAVAAWFPLRLKTGDVIKSIRVYVSNGGGESFTYEVQSRTTSAALSTISGWTTSSAGGTWITVDGGDHTVVSGDDYYFKLSGTKASGASYVAYSLEITVAR